MSARSRSLARGFACLAAALLLAACGGPSGLPGGSDGAATGASNATTGQAPPAAEEPAAQAAPEAAASADETAAEAAPSADEASAEAAPSAEDTGAPAPTSERFKLGTNYIRLSPTQPTSSSPTQVEVAEVFWYGCPHCYHFDAYLKRWLASKASYIHFLRIPAVWNSLLRLHARAFYTAQVLGKGDAMHDAFFNEIHVNHNQLDTEAKLAEFFARFGVDAATFKKTFDSFEVQQKMQRADELNRRYRIMSVPSMVVNGKYMTNGNMVGTYDDMLALVDELAASEKSAE